ncbi:MAG: hypothetical protein ACTSQF_00165 [Candidatus Heimdallarchaeaceae archaeon]
MIPELIDLTNYFTHLVQSTASRSGSPDGNIFFDTTNGRIELITAEELATVDLSGGIGTGAIQIDVVATAGTFTRLSGSFLDDGFIADRSFISSVFTEGGNNNTFIIESVTALVITVTDNTGLVDETGGGDEEIDSVAEDNPLTQQLGIKKEGLYAFENQERRVDEELRKFDRYFKGSFKFAGAYELISGMKYDDADGTDSGLALNSAGDSDDRVKIRASGWIERDTAGAIGRIYYGVKSLGNIELLSQPYYQLEDGAVPVDFAKDGDIDEAIQVYGDNDIDVNAYDTTVTTGAAQTIDVDKETGTFTRSAGDYESDGFIVGHRFEAAGLTLNTETYTVASVTTTVITIIAEEWTLLTDETGDADEALTVTGIDVRTYLSNKIRTFAYNYDEKVLADSGVSQMDGYYSGFALGESSHLTTGNYTLADVYGGAQVSPWTGMGLEELDVAQEEGGFTTANGFFTWVVNNTVPGNLDQVVAFLDALAQTDDDINDHLSNVTNGKRVGTWYTYSAEGKIQPRVGTGAAGEGLFIEQLVGTDKNRVIFTDDAGNTKIYPSYSNVSVAVGADAVGDTLSWFHAFFLDGPAGADYNTSLALTVEDASSVEIKGNVNGSGFRTGNNILFEFDWYLDIIGGPIETDKDCVFLCEGDGGVTQAKTIFTLTNAASITASCTPLVENNV